MTRQSRDNCRALPLRDAILASPALQERLGAHFHPALFDAELHAIAANLGLNPKQGSTTAAGSGAPVTLDRWPQIGWLPARSVPGPGAPAFDWVWFGDRPLSEPMFGASVSAMASRPLSRRFPIRTGLTALIAGATQEATLEPDGIVFHMSRCGSTLVAQMLAAVPHHIVASEAAPIDAMVRWCTTSGAPCELQVAALRAVVAAIGRNRSGAARRYFLKLDSWAILALPLFRAAFPNTPWIFLYRQPEEVMVSQLRMSGMHFAAGQVPALDALDADRIGSIEERGAAVLASYFDCAIEHGSAGSGMLVNYSQLPMAMLEAIPRHFGFMPDARERAAMAAAGRRDAKAPDRAFADDRQGKRAATTPAIAAAVARYLKEPYARVEALRASTTTLV